MLPLTNTITIFKNRATADKIAAENNRFTSPEDATEFHVVEREDGRFVIGVYEKGDELHFLGCL